MANPRAVQVFDLSKAYRSIRDLAAPGAGIWSSPDTIFDSVLYPAFPNCNFFTAGAIDPANPDDGMVAIQNTGQMVFIGTGLPAVPRKVTYTGDGGLPSNVVNYWNSSTGAWIYGGAFYIALSDGTTGQLYVVKSTDGFVTAGAALDTANGPTFSSEVFGRNVSLQRVDDVIYVFAYTDNSGENFAIFPFDLATETWGASFAPLDLPDFFRFALSPVSGVGSGANIWGGGLFKFANGDFLIFYDNKVASVFTSHCRLWTAAGGTWGPELNLPGEVYANTLMDPDLVTVHIFNYNSHNSPEKTLVHYSTYVHGSGLTSDVSSIPAIGGGSAGSDGVGHCSIQNGMIFVPRDESADLTNSVWVATLPVTTFAGGKELLPIPASAPPGGFPSCCYMVFPNGYALTPPAPPTLACPVDGGSGEVGVAYSRTLVRTGGTGPFTFAIIAGSLPPGLTLNTSTGEIHGTPNTAGTFCYTAQVTDSNDLTATVDCCITIINGPIAACPTGDPRIGVAFSVAIPVSGGTEPYTFELTSGALPTGLTLNTSSGVISGTPSAYGTFSYTILITDANDATVTISCSYVIVDPARTLRWQCASPGRPGRWFPHQYAAPVLTHYLVEPNENAPNDQELFMLAGGAILVSGGDTDAGTPITVTAEPGSIDLGDERAQKLYVDAMTEADQAGNVSAQIRFNNSQQAGPTLILSPSGPREQFLENIASLSDLSLYRNISVRYAWTGGPDGPRIYAFEPSGYMQPYLSTFIVTQFINLSFPAWKHHRRMYPALISNAPVIFTIKTQDGRSFITTIPSTGGQYRIIPLIVAHGCKQLAFAYQLDGQGTPFALFPESFTVETKSWDEATYIDLAVFRT